MIDFPFEYPSVSTAIFAIVSYIYILKKGQKVYFVGNTFQSNRVFASGTLFLFYVLISIHSINGDFFHLMNSVHNYDFSPDAYHAQEPVYILIAKIFNRSYLFFRLTVWGIAMYCINKIYTHLEINKYLGIWFFLACYSILFAYARASAGMALYFMGLVLLINNKQSLVVKAVGVGLILLSYEFHHSMLILILLTPLCFFPLNKITFYSVICSLPFLIIVVRIVFSSVLNDISLLDDETLQRKMENYSVREGGNETLRTQIMDGMKYACAYIPFIESSYYIIVKEAKAALNKTSLRFYTYTFWLFVITSAVSYLDLEVNTFFYRMLFMTLIPSVGIYVSLIQKNIVPFKIVKNTLYLCVASQLLNYLYMLYLNILHG